MVSLQFWEGAGVGLLVGFITGFLVASFFNKTKYSPEMFLAWTISIVWISWHTGAGFNLFGVVSPPPVMFDIVSGGSVGFILGEKFFDYISNSVSKVLKK